MESLIEEKRNEVKELDAWKKKLKKDAKSVDKFENAIEYLDKFSGDDEVLSVLAKAGIGDAFLELGQNDDALDYYKKAMAMNNNKFVIPLVLMKAAIVSEMQEDYKSALKYYERIESDFGDSREAADVEKYIAKIEAKMAS